LMTSRNGATRTDAAWPRGGLAKAASGNASKRLGLDEGQQVGVDDLWMDERHAVREALVGF